MSGVISTVRLREIGTKVPSLAVLMIRDILRQGMDYLQEDLERSPANTREPWDTGLMRELTETHVINQYKGEIESPVYYTSYQENGFFNVWAQRWIEGRFFMLDAEKYMQSIADQVVADYLEQL